MSLKQKTALIAALSLLVTGILLGYSAFGWFSMSKTVTAVGQNLTVEAPNYMLISLTGEEGTWENSLTIHLAQDVVGHDFQMMPASSYSGVNGTMWKTDDTIGIPENLTGITMEQATPVQAGAAGEYDGYYVDVPLYFQVYNVPDNSKMVLATPSDITTGDVTSNVDKTARVAFLNMDRDKNSAGGDEPLVYAKEGTAVPNLSVVNAAGTDLVAPDYIFDNGADDLLTFDEDEFEDGACVKSLVVRIWVEGQDSRCVAEIGSKTFNVKLAFAIQENP